MKINEIPKNLSCYIYVRVSTEEQAKEGFSLDNQKRVCIDYANNNGYQVVEVFYEDGKSARSTDRPAFQDLLNAVETKRIDAVIIYKIDRFARNVADFSNIRKQFKHKGVKLISINEGGDVTEGLIGNIFAAVAEWESDVNGKRTSDTMAQKFRNGWFPSWAPLGYKNTKDKNNKKIITIDPDTGPLIKKAFKLYATGEYSYLRLIKKLHKMGLRTRNGKPIAHSTIQQILSNTFYYGLMKWAGQENIGKHEPLISKKLYDVCQLVARKHSNFVIRQRKHDFLLRGFIICDGCGRRYVAEWHKINSSKRDKIAYYHCSNKPVCKDSYVDLDTMEDLVKQILTQIRFSKKFTDAVTRKVKRYLKDRDKEELIERNKLLKKRAALTLKRQTLEDRLLDNTIDRKTFKRLHNDLQSDINNIDDQLARLEKTRKFDFDLLEEVLALTRNIPKAYENAPKFLRRKYLNFFFDEIRVHNKNIVSTGYSPLIKELISQEEVILRTNWLPD